MKRTVDYFYGYGNVGNEKQSFKKIKSLPETNQIGQVLVSNDVQTTDVVAAAWSSSIDLTTVSAENLNISSEAQIQSLSGVQSMSGTNLNMTNVNQANLIGCKIGNTTETGAGTLKYENSNLSYYDDNNNKITLSTRSDNVITVGVGGNYTTLKEATDHANTIPDNESVAIKILSDHSISLSAPITISRSLIITSSGNRKRVVANITSDRTTNYFEITGSEYGVNIVEFNNIDFTFNNQNEYASTNYWDNSCFHNNGYASTLIFRNCKITADTLNCRLIDIAGTLEIHDSIIEASVKHNPDAIGFTSDYTASDWLKNRRSKLIYVADSGHYSDVRKHVIKNSRVTFQDKGLFNLLVYAYNINVPTQVFYFENSLTDNVTTTYNAEILSDNNQYWYYFDAGDFNFNPGIYNLAYMRNYNWCVSIFSLYGKVYLKSESDDFKLRFYNGNSTVFNATTLDYILPFAPVCMMGGDVAHKVSKVLLSNYTLGYKGVEYPTGITGVTESAGLVPANSSSGYGGYKFYHIIVCGLYTNFSEDIITLIDYNLQSGNQRALVQQVLFIEALNSSSDLSMSYVARSDKFAKDLMSNLRDLTQNQTVQNLESSLTTTNTSLTTLTTRVSTAEGNITDLEFDNVIRDTRITALETSDGTQNSNITNLQGRMTNAETNIGTLITGVNNNNISITNLAGYNVTQDERMTAIEVVNMNQGESIDESLSRVGLVETSVGSLNTRITTAEGSITDHGTRLGSIETLNTTQNGRLDTIESVNTTQDGRLTTLEAVAPVVGVTAGTNIVVTGSSTKTIAVLEPPVFNSMTCGNGIINIDGSGTSVTVPTGSTFNIYTNGVIAARIGNDRIYGRTLVGMSTAGGGNENLYMYNCNVADHSNASTGALRMSGTRLQYHDGGSWLEPVTSIPVHEQEAGYYACVSCGMSGGTPSHNLNTTYGANSTGVSVSSNTDPNYFILHVPTAPSGRGYAPSITVMLMATGTQSNIRFLTTRGTNFVQVQPTLDGTATSWSAVTSGQILLMIVMHVVNL